MTPRVMTPRVISIHFDRCICGLRLRLHRDAQNRTLSCDQAVERHRYAQVRHRRLRDLLLASIDEVKR